VRAFINAVDIMKTDKMPNITLSMTKEDQEKLKKSAKKCRRSVSQHVLFLLDEYENKDKVK